MKVKTLSRGDKELERLLKGGANHWRIRIMRIIAAEANLGVDDITEALGANNKTISVHTKVLVQSGLVAKAYRGRKVVHELTVDGRRLLQFLMALA